MGEQADDTKGPKDKKKVSAVERGAWIGIGAGVGVVFGLLIDNIVLGLTCGTAAGVVVYVILGRPR